MTQGKNVRVYNCPLNLLVCVSSCNWKRGGECKFPSELERLPLANEVAGFMAPGNDLWMIAHSEKQARDMTSAWRRRFRGKEPHTRTIKRPDYYLICFWLERGMRNEP
jgi:hypothetical protein